MKKLIMLSVVCLLTLSSFGLKEKKEENAVRTRYVVSCEGVYAGYFVCESSCNYLAIASGMCGY